MLTPTLKVALGAAGIGLIGGAVTERLLSPSSIERSRDGDRWGALHDDFLADHPAPAGTKVFVGSEPAWKSAAVVGGAAAGIAALGGGMVYVATKLPSQPFLLGAAGVAIAALGVAGLAGAGASWAVR